MQNHEAWLKKAVNDLKGAKVLLQEEFNDLAVYHAHQCAEKALKGYLAYKRCPIQKSHDLVLLTEQCYRYDRSFERLRAWIETLNPLATLLRYPTDKPDPSKEMTVAAMEKAEKILSFVKSKID